MADFRVIVSDNSTGSAYQVEISGNQASTFIGKNIGDTVSGDAVKLPGYSLKITGGTDKNGFPMRKGLPGASRRKILIVGGVGFNSAVKGMRRRKAIRSEEIASDIGQINTVVVESGNKSIDELLSGKSEETAQETTEDAEEEISS